MSKYICKIDNSVFTSKEEMIKYITEKYISEVSDSSESKVESIISKLQHEFPDAKINITDGNGWGKYRVDIKFKEVWFNEYLFSDENTHSHNSFSSVDELISFVKHKKEIAEDILSRVRSRYNLYMFKFDRYHDDYGNGDYMDFIYKVTENDEYERREQIDLNVVDAINMFVDKFEQHFVKSVEGEVETRYDNGYFDDYYVNGVPLGGLFERARKVRVEIIE